MKAIMYHYVRPFNNDLPNLKILNYDNFRKQLDYFDSKFGFVHKEEFINSFNSWKKNKGIVLTFDDGFYCHYDFVFKELKKRNLWGIFYIPTQPYTEHKLLDVHRIHILLAKCDSKNILEFLKYNIDDSMFDKSTLNEFRTNTYSLQKNDEYTLMIKRALNYYVSYKYRTNVIDILMDKFIPNESKIFERFYLSKDQILEMHNSGMIIGSHSVNHPVMSRLSLKEQKSQIKNSFNFLEGIVKKFHHKTFCYPYGGFHSFNNHTEKILFQENCLYSFNVDPRDIEEDDIRLRPQALPRYDCNQFLFG